MTLSEQETPVREVKIDPIGLPRITYYADLSETDLIRHVTSPLIAMAALLVAEVRSVADAAQRDEIDECLKDVSTLLWDAQSVSSYFHHPAISLSEAVAHALKVFASDFLRKEDMSRYYALGKLALDELNRRISPSSVMLSKQVNSSIPCNAKSVTAVAWPVSILK